ncbi:MAG: hypothetical protein ACO3AU_09835, partial [Limnohabitans sp.]
SALLRLLRVRDALHAPELLGLKSNTRIDSGGTPATTAVVRLYGRRVPVADQAPTAPTVAPTTLLPTR